MTVHEFLARFRTNMKVIITEINSEETKEIEVFDSQDFNLDGDWDTACVENVEIIKDEMYMNIII